MAEDTEQERTEPATGRRISRAREDGQVAHSRELATFIQLMAAVAVFMVMGGYLMEQLMALARRGFSIDRALAFDAALLWPTFVNQMTDALILLLPVFGILLIASLAEPFMVSGWNFTFKPLTPNWGKLNPLTGIKRIFSVNGWVELAKAILKALLIGGIGVWVIKNGMGEWFALSGESVDLSVAHAGQIILHTALLMVASFLLIAAVDLPFQLWYYAKNLRMTKEEVKQDYKEAEGDPQIKSRIRAKQREAARARMMAAVPKADVIVTNPTHFAVALQYDEKMAAPQVVAKGAALLAERILEIAREHQVPVLEAPPLARALYHHAEVGDEIPQKLYTAVAEVLAYVYQIKRPEYGNPSPRPPQHLPVPEDMDPMTRRPEDFK